MGRAAWWDRITCGRRSSSRLVSSRSRPATRLHLSHRSGGNSTAIRSSISSSRAPKRRTRPSGRLWPASTQARALVRVAGSFLYPTISLDPRFIRERLSGNRDSTITGQRVQSGATINDWLIPLDLTYEIDVWGRVRRSFESAQAQATASVDDLASCRAHRLRPMWPSSTTLFARWTLRCRS